MDEVVEALEKHRNTAVHYKDVADAQRKKANHYRELTNKLQDDLDSLEEEIREKEHFTEKVVKEKNDFENEVKFLIEKLDLKNEDIMRIEFNLNKQKEVSQKLFTNLMNEKEVLKDDLDLANDVIKEGEAFSKAAEEQKESLLILKDEVMKLKLENFEKWNF